MNRTELVSGYLQLFGKRWDDPLILPELRGLRTAATDADLADWVSLIDARIAWA
jgi:hypothetical protein